MQGIVFSAAIVLGATANDGREKHLGRTFAAARAVAAPLATAAHVRVARIAEMQSAKKEAAEERPSGEGGGMSDDCAVDTVHAQRADLALAVPLRRNN